MQVLWFMHCFQFEKTNMEKQHLASIGQKFWTLCAFWEWFIWFSLTDTKLTLLRFWKSFWQDFWLQIALDFSIRWVQGFKMLFGLDITQELKWADLVVCLFIQTTMPAVQFLLCLHACIWFTPEKQTCLDISSFLWFSLLVI